MIHFECTSHFNEGVNWVWPKVRTGGVKCVNGGVNSVNASLSPSRPRVNPSDPLQSREDDSLLSARNTLMKACIGYCWRCEHVVEGVHEGVRRETGHTQKHTTRTTQHTTTIATPQTTTRRPPPPLPHLTTIEGNAVTVLTVGVVNRWWGV